MSHTLYVFGAGINRGIATRSGSRPPLATDFFQQMLRHRSLAEDKYPDKLDRLLDYVARYWKLSRDQLMTQPFDLEACFTLIQQQLHDAIADGDKDSLQELAAVQYQLTMALLAFLSEFRHQPPGRVDDLSSLAEGIYKDSASVITFNYDTLLEDRIEAASGLRTSDPWCLPQAPPEDEVPDDQLPRSHYNWNRPLAYGVPFDEVQLHRSGNPTRVSGDRFYAHPENTLYRSVLLKMHGSLDWFRYTSVHLFDLTGHGDAAQRPDSNDRNGQTVLTDILHGMRRLDRTVLVMDNMWAVEPIVLTPALHKAYDDQLIRAIWRRARAELSSCTRLVVGGYSFSPTDFAVRRLFLESFADHALQELVVINPDTSVVGVVKELCHFKEPVLVCANLREFLRRHTP